jgi:hypothetical protein
MRRDASYEELLPLPQRAQHRVVELACSHG